MATLKNTVLLGSANTLSLPSGTTAQRPATPAEGMIRYNTDLKYVEVFLNNAWSEINAGRDNCFCYIPLFGDNDADITDTITNTRGTLTGTVTRNSSIGGYAGLYTDSGYLDFSNVWLRKLDGNPFWTIEFWLYRTGGEGGTASTMLEFFHYTTGLLYRGDTSAGANHYWQSNPITFAVPPNNAWTHHAIVGYGSSIKVFHNGTQVSDTIGSATTSRFTDPITNASTTFRLGRSNHTVSAQYTRGYFRKFKVSGVARYLSNFTPANVHPL